MSTDTDVDLAKAAVSPADVFENMTARKAVVEEMIQSRREIITTAYAQIAEGREELKTIKRLLSAAKPRTRTKRERKTSG